MAPYLDPHAQATQGDPGPVTHIVFVPVPGAVVFCVCVLLIFFCVVWLGMLLHKGVEHDKET